MTATQFYTILGIITLVIALLAQATRGIYKVGLMKAEVMEAIKGVKDDIEGIKAQVMTLDKRVYDNAIRNPQRR